jgi:hypothetical protein
LVEQAVVAELDRADLLLLRRDIGRQTHKRSRVSDADQELWPAFTKALACRGYLRVPSMIDNLEVEVLYPA